MLLKHKLIPFSVAFTAALAALKVPFTNQLDDHLSPDIDGPWPTIPIHYNDSDSMDRSLNAYMTFSSVSLLVMPQKCAGVTNNTFLCGEFNYPDFYLGRQIGNPTFKNFSSGYMNDISSEHAGLETRYFIPLSGWFTRQTLRTNLGTAIVETPAIVAENLTTYLSNTSYPVPLLNSMLSIPNFSDKLWQSGVTSSQFSSFHTGSMNPMVNGSFIAGGYDNNRIMGDMISWNTTYDVLFGRPDGFVTLTQINIGVESGFLPLENVKLVNGSYPQGPYKFKSIYVPTDGEDDLYETSLLVEPGSPYMHLNTRTCDRIADMLDLAYDTTRNLYLWTYPPDHPIFQSPVFLELILTGVGYSEYKPGSYSELSVKIPMKLLQHTFHATTRAMNGTLVSPARYFPCSRRQFDFGDGRRTYSRLGRALLQAAFIGSSFHYHDDYTTATFWLAQAPGPMAIEQNGEDIVEVESGFIPIRTNVTLDANAWTKSWSGVLPIWTVDADEKTTLDQLNAVVPQVEDRAKELGIKVGIPIAGTLLAGVILYFSIRGIITSRATRKRIHREIAEEDATAREIERLMISEKEMQPISRGSTDEEPTNRRGSAVSSLNEDHTRPSRDEEVSLLETDDNLNLQN